jgi:hypothetical protein
VIEIGEAIEIGAAAAAGGAKQPAQLQGSDRGG